MNSIRRWLPMPLVALAAACDPMETAVQADDPDLDPERGADASPDAHEQDAGDSPVEKTSCSLHADCASDLCRRSTSSALGVCVAEARIIYVDRTACGDGGDGSRAAPLCSIHEAVDRADSIRYQVRVYPSLYLPFTVGATRVDIYGPDPGDAVASVSEEDVDGTVLLAGARVLIDGLLLGRHSRFGILCEGEAALTVRRSEIDSDTGVGLIAVGCSVRLDRVRVGGLNGGMRLTGTSYLVSNSVFSGTSERPAIVVDGGSGRIILSTITGNGDTFVAQPAITCNTRVQLADSIVFGNVPGPDGSQLAGDCRLTRVVIGRADPFPAAGAIRLDPDLEAFRLARSPANLECCIDRAPARPAFPADFFGTPRPQGPLFDIGASEAL
jgi:hypothetical protein